ncbi:MAG: hypothetical protein SAK29_27670 [Scytonema sp. PMC 1069.18]|nr:hypothetical protein [Scytonema sp. PMC 1069.18]MEC4883711.1 hypothetical protein [Scytonema sp. PMC 1070.18]
MKYTPKRVSTIVIASTLFLGASGSLAETCASKCGPEPIQFKPGQLIRLEVINITPRTLKVEKPYNAGQVSIQPGQQIRIEQGDGTEPNISLVFWDDTGRPLKAIVTKPNFGTLRVELRPNWYIPGDRTVYIRDDGRVNVF